MAKKQENKPEKVFRIGQVSASIFAREVELEGGTRTLRSVSIQKRYRDGDDWKYTNSLNLSELPPALRCLELAQRYIEPLEADLTFD